MNEVASLKTELAAFKQQRKMDIQTIDELREVTRLLSVAHAKVSGIINRPNLDAHMDTKSDLLPTIQNNNTTENQLSSFIDSTTVVSEGTPFTISKLHKSADPFPNQGLGSVLERQFLVSQFSWTSSDTSGSLLFTGDFPYLLLKIEAIENFLAYFRYLQSGLEIEVRLNSTPQLYGTLLVCGIPHFTDVNSNGIGWPTSMAWWAATDCAYLDVTSQSTIKLKFPYVASQHFWDLTQPASTAQGFFAKMKIFCLTPLLSQTESGVATIDVSVYARFVDPHPAGFTHIPNYVNTEARPILDSQKKKSNKATVELNPKPVTLNAHMNREGETRSREGVISSVAEATHTVAETLKVFPVIGGVASAVSPVAKAVASLAKSVGLDKPTSVESTHQNALESASGLSHVSGLDNSHKLSLDPQAKIANDNVFCEPDYDKFQNYKRLPGLIEVDYLDATDTINTIIYETPVAPTIAMIDTSGTPAKKVTYLTPVGNYASYFRYWRGSLDFCFTFVLSQFASVRLVIEWIPNEYSSSAVTGADFGNYARMTVDVKGTTNVCFKIPYLANTPYLVVPSPDMVANPTSSFQTMNGRLTVRVLNPPVTSTSLDQSQIWFHVWMAGGSDFTCSRPTTLWKNYVDIDAYPATKKLNAHAGGSQTMRQIFSSEFHPLIKANMVVMENVVNPDTAVSFTELFHRYTLQTNEYLSVPYNQLSITGVIEPWKISDFVNSSQFKRYLKLFLQHRGSLRVKLLVNRDSITEPDYISPGVVSSYAREYSYTLTVYNYVDDGSNTNEDFLPWSGTTGMYTLQAPQRKVVEVEVPYYGIMPMLNYLYTSEMLEFPTLRFEIALNTVNRTGNPMTFQYQVLVAAGDDKSNGVLLPPNPIQLID
jgi:hypothetical protein